MRRQQPSLLFQSLRREPSILSASAHRLYTQRDGDSNDARLHHRETKVSMNSNSSTYNKAGPTSQSSSNPPDLKYGAYANGTGEESGSGRKFGAQRHTNGRQLGGAPLRGGRGRGTGSRRGSIASPSFASSTMNLKFYSADGWMLTESSGTVDAMALFSAPNASEEGGGGVSSPEHKATSIDPWGGVSAITKPSTAPSWIDPSSPKHNRNKVMIPANSTLELKGSEGIVKERKGAEQQIKTKAPANQEGEASIRKHTPSVNVKHDDIIKDQGQVDAKIQLPRREETAVVSGGEYNRDYNRGDISSSRALRSLSSNRSLSFGDRRNSGHPREATAAATRSNNWGGSHSRRKSSEGNNGGSSEGSVSGSGRNNTSQGNIETPLDVWGAPILSSTGAPEKPKWISPTYTNSGVPPPETTVAVAVDRTPAKVSISDSLPRRLHAHIVKHEQQPASSPFASSSFASYNRGGTQGLETLPSGPSSSSNSAWGSTAMGQKANNANTNLNSQPQQVQQWVEVGRPAPLLIVNEVKPRIIGRPKVRAGGGTHSDSRTTKLDPAAAIELFASQKKARIVRYLPASASEGRDGTRRSSATEWLLSHSSGLHEGNASVINEGNNSRGESRPLANAVALIDPVAVAEVLSSKEMFRAAIGVLLEALEETRAAESVHVDAESQSPTAHDADRMRPMASNFVDINKPYSNNTATMATGGASFAASLAESPIFAPLNTAGGSRVEMSFQPHTKPTAAPTTTTTVGGTSYAAEGKSVGAATRPRGSLPLSSLTGAQLLPSGGLSLGLSAPTSFTSSSGTCSTGDPSGENAHRVDASKATSQEACIARRNVDAARFSAALVPLYAKCGDWQKGLEFAGTDMISLPPTATEALIDSVIDVRRDAGAWTALAESIYFGYVSPFLRLLAKADLSHPNDRKKALHFVPMETGITVERCRALLYSDRQARQKQSDVESNYMASSSSPPPSASALYISEEDRVSSALCVWNTFAKRTGQSNVSMVLALAEGLLMRDADIEIAHDFLTPLIFNTLGLEIPLPYLRDGGGANGFSPPRDGQQVSNVDINAVRYAVINGVCKILIAEKALKTEASSSYPSASSLASLRAALKEACELCADIWSPFSASIERERRESNFLESEGKKSMKERRNRQSVGGGTVPSMDALINEKGRQLSSSAASSSFTSSTASPNATSGRISPNLDAGFGDACTSSLHSGRAQSREPDDNSVISEEELNALLDEGRWEDAFDVLPTIVAAKVDGVVAPSPSLRTPNLDTATTDTSVSRQQVQAAHDAAHLLPDLSRVRVGIANHVLAKALSGRAPLPLEALRSLLGFATREGLFEAALDGCLPVIAVESTATSNNVASDSSSATSKPSEKLMPLLPTACDGHGADDVDPSATVYGYSAAFTCTRNAEGTACAHPCASPAAVIGQRQRYVRVRVFTEGQRQAAVKSLSKLIQRLASNGSEIGRFEGLLAFLALGAASDGMTAANALFVVEEMGRSGSIGGGDRGGGEEEGKGGARISTRGAAALWDALNEDANADICARDREDEARLRPRRSSAGTSQHRPSAQDADARRAALLHCFAVYKSMASPIRNAADEADVYSYSETNRTFGEEEPFATYVPSDLNDSHVARKLLRTLAAHTNAGTEPINIIINDPAASGSSEGNSQKGTPPQRSRVPSALDVLAAAFPANNPSFALTRGHVSGKSSKSSRKEKDQDQDHATPLALALFGESCGSSRERRGLGSKSGRASSSTLAFEERSQQEAFHAAARSLRLMPWDAPECWQLGLRVSTALKSCGAGALLGPVIALKLPYMPAEAQERAETLLYGEMKMPLK